MLKDRLEIFPDPGRSRPGIVLESGTSLVITKTDDKKWCAVETEDGTEGWFELDGCCKLPDGRFPPDVFDGLAFVG